MGDIVNITYESAATAVLSISDRENRNMFSDLMMQELAQAFAEVNDNDDIKVLVIHGDGGYFIMGGGKEGLVAINKREINFLDFGIHQLFLDCKVPMIAAMNGHALGAGLSIACFPDIMVMATGSTYSANFMKYGFTPGMGATYLLPKRFGDPLAWEMMYSAKDYYGRDLQARGVTATFAKRPKVLPTALAMAKELEQMPSLSLKLLRSHRVSLMRDELIATIKKEIKMHDDSATTEEVAQLINQYFQEDNN